MESSMSVSSRESLYSVDSTSSEEEDYEHCANFEVFLSDSGSDPEKEVGPLRSQQDAYPVGQSFLYSLKSKQTNPGFLCQGHERHARKSLGVLASARLRPSGPCCRYPAMLGESRCTHLRNAGGGLPRKAASQGRRESSGRKRPSGAVGGNQSPEHPVQPSLAGCKRRRSRALPREDPCPFDWTEGDQLFAQKCRELQGFILPLQELLIRLKMGRFDRGLSTFQQSVAMDRIQRIIGVLQKPGMGERYLGTLLQVERMLKVWFPNVALKSSCADGDRVTENTTETAKQSWPAHPVVPRKAVSVPNSAESPPAEKLHQTHLTDALPDSKGKAGFLSGEPAPFLADWPTMNLTWIHTSPISNPPLGHVNSPFGQALLGPAAQSTYGIVLFLHNNPAPFGSSDRSTSVTPALPHPACFPLSRRLPSSGELPRCQSLPGTTQGGSCLTSGPLACHSRSLPRLPTSGEKLPVASERLPCCDS